jgi:uncharacterized phiE125 gp8 family phage protein
MTYPNWSLLRGSVDANTEPVTLAQAKLHLRVDHDDENAAISLLCTGARETCEAFTNRALASGTWTLKLDAFPYELIRIPVGVANLSVQSINYVDADGVEQTWANTEYLVLQRQDQFPEIVPAYGWSFPSTRCQRDAVTISFTAEDSPCPTALVQGMLLQIGHLYEQRESTVVGTSATVLPLGRNALWSPYRLTWL